MTLFAGEQKALEHASVHLNNTVDLLRQWSTQVPSAKYLLQPIADWLSSQLVAIIQPQPDASSTFSEERLLNLYLVSVQDLLALCSEPKAEDDDSSISITLQNAFRISSGLNMPQVLSELQSAFVSLVLSDIPLGNKVASIQRLEPFTHIHLRLIEHHLTGLASLTRALSKLGYVITSIILTLAKQGFCKPPEGEQDGTGAEGAEVDGTGLGAGSGAKNVSNEIEDESQVEGLRGQEEEDDEERGDGEDENAIEMGDDIGGKLEDVPEKEEGDEEDGVSDEEDDGPEERREDLDASDPNAVDEKLWGDEAGDDDSKGPDEKTSEDRSKEDAGESEVVAKEGAKESSKEKDESKETEEGKPQGEENEEGEDEDVMQEDLPDETQPNENGAPMDEHVPDANALDLPDDLDLDTNDKGAEDEDEDLKEDEMSLDGGSDAGMDEDMPPEAHDAPPDENAAEEQGEDVTMTFAGEDEQVRNLLQSPSFRPFNLSFVGEYQR